jgi:hypothetical protein
MKQYTERKIPVLLKKAAESTSSFKLSNGMAELTIDGEKVFVPTAEAFNRLLKKVAVLEQRLYSIDNKASRVAKQQ